MSDARSRAGRAGSISPQPFLNRLNRNSSAALIVDPTEMHLARGRRRRLRVFKMSFERCPPIAQAGVDQVDALQ